jgi:hypothetical protein
MDEESVIWIRFQAPPEVIDDDSTEEEIQPEIET